MSTCERIRWLWILIVDISQLLSTSSNGDFLRFSAFYISILIPGAVPKFVPAFVHPLNVTRCMRCTFNFVASSFKNEYTLVHTANASFFISNFKVHNSAQITCCQMLGRCWLALRELRLAHGHRHCSGGDRSLCASQLLVTSQSFFNFQVFTLKLKVTFFH